MELKAKSAAHIAPGVYRATLVDIESRDGENGEFLIWKFEIPAKTGLVKLSGVSSTNFGPAAKARKWTETLLNRKFLPDEVFETDDLIDIACQIVVVDETKNGTVFSRIDNVLGLPSDDDPPY